MPETSSHASAASFPTTVLDQSAQSHLESLYRAAVGPIQADYYVPILARFEAYGRVSPSWNWAACVCTLNWMVFRGLWLPALVYVGTVTAAAAVVWLIIAPTAPPIGASMRWSLWAGLATLVLLVPGVFGNAWLYRSYHRRLDQALAHTNSLRDACLQLARRSSTRPRLVAIVLANLALAALLAIGFWPRAMPTQMGPRASGEVENLAAPAAPAAAASAASAATVVANKVPAPVIAPIAQLQIAASAPQAATGASLPDFDLQNLGPAARGALAQDTVIRKHSRSNRHQRSATATKSNPTTSAAQPTLPAAAPTTGTPALAANDSGHFLINVGLFAQQDNALRAVTRLTAAGLPATSTLLETPNGPRSRVQVGPFTSRAQADDAAQQIRAMRLDAVVIRQ